MHDNEKIANKIDRIGKILTSAISYNPSAKGPIYYEQPTYVLYQNILTIMFGASVELDDDDTPINNAINEIKREYKSIENALGKEIKPIILEEIDKDYDGCDETGYYCRITTTKDYAINANESQKIREFLNKQGYRQDN